MRATFVSSSMNPLEQQLQYTFGDAMPEPGGTIEAAPGVRWIRMSLPFALDHINLWLLRDELDGRAGWTVVDCCVAADVSRAQWEQVFATQLGGLPVLRVLATHMHPDHIGLANWLCERWSTPEHPCRLWISATDYSTACENLRNAEGLGSDRSMAFLATHGMDDPEVAAQVRGRANRFAALVNGMPDSFVRLQDGQDVMIGGHAWRCIDGYGHAPEHIALYCAALGVLISGDMVLPRISTNVSVYDSAPESNPLDAFLTSIERFRALPADTLVLPSHGKPFRGLHTRIDQLQDHHRERLADVLAACASAPRSAMDALPVLFHRQLDQQQIPFAVGESIAHLHLLWHAGRLARARGADGVWRFTPTA